MRNCNIDKDLLILAANKDLSWIKRIKVYKHTLDCENCRKLYLEYKSIQELLKQIPDQEAPDKLIKSIENHTGIKSGEPSIQEDLLSILFFSRWKLAGATVLIVFVISLILFRNNTPEPDKSKADDYYSASEVNTANIKAKEAFALLGKFLNKTQVQLESDILGNKVSRPLNKGLITVSEIFTKGDKNESN